MLFGNLFGNKVNPRRFIYTPRYYDAENDTDRSERVRFDKSPLRPPTRKRTGGSPWMMLGVVGVVLVLILSLQHGQKQKIPFEDVEITPADAAPVETAQADSMDAERP